MNTKAALNLIFACIATVALALDKPAITANATNRFEITGMHCDGCARGIGAELKQTRGVVACEVSFTNKLAVVAYDTNRISSAKLVKVIGEAGYKAKVIQP